MSMYALESNCAQQYKALANLCPGHVSIDLFRSNAPGFQNSFQFQTFDRATCERITIEVARAAKYLAQHDLEGSAKVLEAFDKAVYAPSGNYFSIFDPKTWTHCFDEFWYGDCLPNDPERPRRISFENNLRSTS